ncbi:2'-5' RNA ligase family protein [Candidatus Roizmanbacteria bacterium]|nr:2'-5' RNA ligase family protein [Candidatus Roizmanbacteria bacterium]
MSTYQQKQQQLFSEIEQKFKQGASPSHVVEPVSDYPNDERICLTCISLLPPLLEEKIMQNLIVPLQTADPRQYYYVPRSLHLTLQNIRTIHNPPLFTPQDIEKVKNVLANVIPRHTRFTFDLKKLFELPTSVSVSAFSDESLFHLVRDLRRALEEVGVSDNKKCASERIFFGNTTFVRFTTSPNEAFQEKIQQLKHLQIGKFEIQTISLISTNSVCSPEKTIVHGNYQLT